MEGIKQPTSVVVVTGDVTMDWNLQRLQLAPTSPTVWNAADTTRGSWHRGGAALLADLIEAVVENLTDATSSYKVCKIGAPTDQPPLNDPRYNHSYAMWSLYDHQRDSSRWRVSEFFGLDRSKVDMAEWGFVGHDTEEAEVVVLDDADLGFRSAPQFWPAALSSPERKPWIVLKMAKPVAKGALWTHLHENHSDRLVVVMTVNDLRLSEVQISRELSWERTAQDLLWELLYNPHIDAVSECAHVVISFDTAGALLLSRNALPKCVLFFDPEVVEGMWGQKYPGGSIGYTSCLTAGIVRQLLGGERRDDIGPGIQAGLAAMRKLHEFGYGGQNPKDAPCELAFPTALIVGELGLKEKHFAEVEVEDPARFLNQTIKPRLSDSSALWTILRDTCEKRMDETRKSLEQVAQDVVLKGTEAVLKGVPIGRFGDLITVDRREIEAYRSIRVLITEYLHHDSPKRPLSIGVFGAPGSGKSFGITEVAKSVDKRVKKLTINLSQFTNPSELLGAFHEVRDKVLSGEIPLVFWDEFDTAQLAWLRCFLAPMQDGSFQEGQITHPIGRAIFVFAGGTSDTRQSFGKKMKPEDFEAAKGPDFVSRLQGYIDIMGPNPVGSAESDPYYLIRRAILLRSMIERGYLHLLRPTNNTGELQIDSGVLRAFLNVQDFKHGARSIESIIAMSTLADRSTFERSSLPSEAQLSLHVDGRAFLALVQQIVLDEKVLDRLAELNHGIYQQGLAGRNQSTANAEKTYSELADHDKQENRKNVEDIPNKLAAIGYVMTPARANEQSADITELVEHLAEMEHWRWMNSKIDAGYQWGPDSDPVNYLHEALLPWRKLSVEERAQLYTPAQQASIGMDELSNEQKDKDRDLVRGIPQVLAAAGYTIVKVRDETNKKGK